MAKKAKPRHGEPPVVNYVVGGTPPTSFSVPLTPEQLAKGNQGLNTIVQQACTNTTQYAAIVAAADWLRGAYNESESYLVSELCIELGGISSATLNKYAGLAGLEHLDQASVTFDIRQSNGGKSTTTLPNLRQIRSSFASAESCWEIEKESKARN